MAEMQRNSYPKNRCRQGFTLVELLVVIGIIALLISILLPSLSKARESSNRVACMSNMKQIATALIMFANDHKGSFPRPAAAVDPDDWIYWQTTRVQDDGALVPYMGGHFNPKLFTCTSDSGAAHLKANPPYPYSYTVNETICRAPQKVGTNGQPGYNPGPTPSVPSLPPLKITQIPLASQKILLIDESDQTVDDGCWAPQNYTASNPTNLLANRHDKRGEQPTSTNPSAGRGNVAFCDSHVDFVQRSLSVDPINWDGPWNGDGTAP